MAGAGRTGDPLAAVAPVLRCPVCGDAVAVSRSAVLCSRGHSFDRARQGYVSMLGRALKFHGDGAEMIAARHRLLSGDSFEPLLSAVADAAESVIRQHEGRVVLDAGCGTGQYLERVLDSAPAGERGIALDASKPAMRLAARAHPAAAAVRADAWSTLPIASASVAAVLSVFAPRNPAEFARVLMPGGAVIVASPGPEHLRELVARLELLRVDGGKRERLGRAMRDFEESFVHRVRWSMRLSRSDALCVAGMGPSAYHVTDAEFEERLAGVPEPFAVRGDVVIRVYRAAYG